MAIYGRMTIKGRGGALPTYNGHDAPYTPGSGVNVRVSGADARILAAAQRMEADAAKDLFNAGRNALKVGIEALDDYNKTKATELVTKYKMGMRDAMYGENGILLREGEAAFTADTDVADSSKKLKTELLKDYSGSMVEEIFNRRIEADESDCLFKAQEYKGKQYRVYQDRTDGAAFSELADTAMRSYSDPRVFSKNVGEALYFQEQMLRRKGYSGEALERGLKETSSKVFIGAIDQALSKGDIDDAQRILDMGSKTRMTSPDAASASDKIKAKIEALQKQAEADAKNKEIERVNRESDERRRSVMQILNTYPDTASQDEKMAQARVLLKDIDDPKVKDGALKLIEQELKEQSLDRKA
jgi:hypothetical protein